MPVSWAIRLSAENSRDCTVCAPRHRPTAASTVSAARTLDVLPYTSDTLHQLSLPAVHSSGRYGCRGLGGLLEPSGGWPMTEERAVLAGGGFWGVQGLIRRYDGVLSTQAGYTGGSVSHATYRHHGSHAEAVEVIFDPARVSSRQILEFFFQ